MNEKELVRRVLEADSKACKKLIEQYERLVASIVFRLVDDQRDREEIAQDIFMKVFSKIESFSFQSKLSTWIATIAYRETVSFMRKKKKVIEKDLDDVKISANLPGMEQSDMQRFISEAIDQLPSNYGVILKLYHIEGFSYPEIVEVMDIPEGTVKNYLFRARKKLKDILLPYLEKEHLLYE